MKLYYPLIFFFVWSTVVFCGEIDLRERAEDNYIDADTTLTGNTINMIDSSNAKFLDLKQPLKYTIIERDRFRGTKNRKVRVKPNPKPHPSPFSLSAEFGLEQFQGENSFFSAPDIHTEVEAKSFSFLSSS